MQTLFDSSEEVGGGVGVGGEGGEGDEGISGATKALPGLGVVPGSVVRFDESEVGAVPHIGWNGLIAHQKSPVFGSYASSSSSSSSSSTTSPPSFDESEEPVYFVHSYYAPIANGVNDDWVLTSTTYGEKRYISSVQRGCVVATQFHPEKSGSVGLNILRGFLEVRFFF